MAATTNNNIVWFQTELLIWFKSNGRSFPWRNKRLSHFKLIIAEVLLQRTRAETVAKIYHNFLDRFDSWNAIASSNLNAISKGLKPLGLQIQRAGRLKSLAKEMVKRNGRLPNDRIELQRIPFMGQYIANSVELLIHRKPAPLLDVNMARVLERFFHQRKLTDIRFDPFLQGLSNRIVDHSESRDLNWAILDFSALVCRPKPKCEICPISKKCSFFHTTNPR